MERKSEMNIAPFYTGQKVVCTNLRKGCKFKQGIVYTVKDCRWLVSSNPIAHGASFWYVRIVEIDDTAYGYSPTIFAPIEQKEFPAMEYSEIIELEIVSMN